MKILLDFSEKKKKETEWLLKRRYGHRYKLKSLINMAISDIIWEEIQKVVEESEGKLGPKYVVPKT